MTELKDAVRHGDHQRLEQALKGRHQHELDDALVDAARTGDTAAMNTLLAKGAEPKPACGKKPIEAAVLAGSAAAIRILTARGARAEEETYALLDPDRHGEECLMALLEHSRDGAKPERALSCWIQEEARKHRSSDGPSLQTVRAMIGHAMDAGAGISRDCLASAIGLADRKTLEMLLSATERLPRDTPRQLLELLGIAMDKVQPDVLQAALAWVEARDGRPSDREMVELLLQSLGTAASDGDKHRQQTVRVALARALLRHATVR